MIAIITCSVDSKNSTNNIKYQNSLKKKKIGSVVKSPFDNYLKGANLEYIKKDYQEEMQEVAFELKVKTSVFLKKLRKENKNPKVEL